MIRYFRKGMTFLCKVVEKIMIWSLHTFFDVFRLDKEIQTHFALWGLSKGLYPPFHWFREIPPYDELMLELIKERENDKSKT